MRGSVWDKLEKKGSSPERTRVIVSASSAVRAAVADAGSVAVWPSVEVLARVRSGVVRVNVVTCDGAGSVSGMTISPWHVVTVEHVVDGASAIRLERSRDNLSTAEVIGVDRD